jgi:hypothetical protein
MDLNFGRKNWLFFDRPFYRGFCWIAFSNLI